MYRLVLSVLLLSFIPNVFALDYRKLRENVDELVRRGLPVDAVNVITNGIPKQFQDSWSILMDQVQQYVEFRGKDEAINTADMVLTFQNLVMVKDELFKAIKDKALSPQGIAKQKLEEVMSMIKDKEYKIKNIPVLGIGKEEDVWYLLNGVLLFLNNLFNRIAIDLQKASGTQVNK